MNQGDIYWVDLQDDGGRRPALIITRQSALALLTVVTVAPLTTTIRQSRTWVELNEVDGVPRRSFINCDGIQTVQMGQCEEFVTHLSPARLREVARAVDFALGLDLLR